MNIQVFVATVYLVASLLFFVTYLSSQASQGSANDYIWLGLSIVFFVLAIYQFIMYRKGKSAKK